MSDPSRPPREPITPEQVRRATLPVAYLKGTQQEYDELRKSLKNAGRLTGVLNQLDMQIKPAIVLDKSRVAAPEGQKAGTLMAMADTGRPVPRIRSAYGVDAALAFFQDLEPHWVPTKGLGIPDITAACEAKVFWSGGAENCTGRLLSAYPRAGSRGVERPITRGEAVSAYRACGFWNADTDEPLSALKIFTSDPSQAVKINQNSENGFPVLGKWTTEGAPTKVLQLVADLTAYFTRALSSPGGVYAAVRQREVDHPQEMAFKGKAKNDFYKEEKILSHGMRFYVVTPRQLALIMQTVTQPWEAACESIFDDFRIHSAMGITFTRGGAQLLVDRLEQQLEFSETSMPFSETRTPNRIAVAYAHHADDTFFAVRVRYESGRLRFLVFSLDCTAFDLTQRSEMSIEAKNLIGRNLAEIDRMPGDLWLALMRSRLTVVVGTFVRQMEHGGPSGMMLQSKVNDMIMQVLCRRIELELLDARTTLDISERNVSEMVERLGRQMGLKVRLENLVDEFVDPEYPSLGVFLHRNPFLFLGYYLGGNALGEFLSNETNALLPVHPFVDHARMLAQLPYPSEKWVKLSGQLKVNEAIRIGSIANAMGIPPWQFRSAHNSLRMYALRLIEDVIDQYGDVADPGLRFSIQEEAWGPEAIPSLSGLRRSLLDTSRIWRKADGLVPVNEFGSSKAEEFEDDFVAGVQRLGPQVSPPAESAVRALSGRERGSLRFVPPAPLEENVTLVGHRPPRAIPRPSLLPLAHPVTAANDGRPPPTARWAPDKPKATRWRVLSRLERVYRRHGVDAEGEDVDDEESHVAGSESAKSFFDDGWYPDDYDDSDDEVYANTPFRYKWKHQVHAGLESERETRYMYRPAHGDD
jgi:hypothetical protein